MNIFVSYSHKNPNELELLLTCLADAKYKVWYDKRILGGQKWWETILQEIEGCSVFIAAMTPEYWDSVFCLAEFHYARALGKPILPVDLKKVNLSREEISHLQVEKFDVNNCQGVVDAVTALEGKGGSIRDVKRPPVPVEPLSQLRKSVKGLSVNDDQMHLFDQLMIFWNVDEPAVREILEAFYHHENILARVRDRIKEKLPYLGCVLFINRDENSRYVPYSTFISEAKETIHNYGAGLGSVGPDIKQYQDAIARGVKLHFMILDQDIVTDGTAHFFSKKDRNVILAEINTSLQHLYQLVEKAQSDYSEDYFRHVMLRLRETGPDMGIIARDIDTPNGVIRIEPYLYDASIKERFGLLLFPQQDLYKVYRDMIKRLWADANESVAAIIINNHHQILLTKRNIDPFKGQWCIPGGHIDVGETRQEAIIREVREETGLDFNPRFFRRFFEDFPEIDHPNWVNVFEGEEDSELFQVQASEVKEIGWFELDEAIQLGLAFGHKDVLEAYKEKRMISK